MVHPGRADKEEGVSTLHTSLVNSARRILAVTEAGGAMTMLPLFLFESFQFQFDYY